MLSTKQRFSYNYLLKFTSISRLPSSDIKGNANNASLSSLMVNNNKVSSTYLMVNDNKVSPTYNDYVVYALPTVYKVMPHRPVFVGE